MFVDDLRLYGSSPALVDEHGRCLSYDELADAVDNFIADVGPGRRLMLLAAVNDIDAIIAYLAALKARIPVIVTDAEGARPGSRIRESFSPELIYSRDKAGWRLERLGEGRGGDNLHPDLALMLSTSGSTGSPRLVRLSRGAVDANARSIRAYLAIGPGQRAITSLPIFYSYGLSVVNSHLASGACVLVTSRSVTDAGFWAFLREAGATSMAGVPYTYEMLERLGFRDDPPPTLECLTQAGGRMAPDMLREYAKWAQAHGRRFFAMYGQTEATARIAYLPPEMAARHCDCIGVAIPGGDISLRDENGRTIVDAGETGELVYSGPNVMMGYAKTRGDLARGPELSALSTGDLAERTPEGLFRIVGRKSRFSKIGGKRIGHDDLEALLARWDTPAIVTGNEEHIVAWLHAGTDAAPARLRTQLAAVCGLPPATILVIAGREIPRLPSGKLDVRAMLEHAREEVAERGRQRVAEGGSAVAAAYMLVSGRPRIRPSDTFLSIGGDSLAFVQASLEIEKILGDIPDGWEEMTVAELDRLATLEESVPQPATVTRIPSEWLLRLAATTLVIVHHVHLDMAQYFAGGASLLMLLVGHSLAGFQHDRLFGGESMAVLRHNFMQIGIPYLLLVMLAAPFADKGQFTLATLFMVGNFSGQEQGIFQAFWFIETFFQILLLTCLLFRVRVVREFARAQPFVAGFALYLFALALRRGVPMLIELPTHYGNRFTPDAWMVYFTLGWMVCFARQGWQKFAVLLLVMWTVGLGRAPAGLQPYLISLGVGVLLFCPRVAVPRWVARPVMVMTAATFFTYLAHMFVIRVVQHGAGVDVALVIVAISFAAGVIGSHVWQQVLLRVRAILAAMGGDGPSGGLTAPLIRAGIRRS